MPAPTSVRRLRDAAQECEGCELHEAATQVVMGEGSTSARLMLVGEQPGDREDEEGHPFVGPAGALLDRALTAAEIGRDDVFVTNAVKHFRFEPRGKRRIHKSPGQRHIAACRPWLVAELALVRPEGVLLLGATAVGSLWGAKARLADHRGRFEPWPEAVALPHSPSWVSATTHPSAVLRSRQREEDMAALVADIVAVRRQLDR